MTARASAVSSCLAGKTENPRLSTQWRTPRNYDSNPEIGSANRTPLQALVLPEDSTAVSHFSSPKETSTLERRYVRDSSSDTIDVNVVHILRVDQKY